MNQRDRVRALLRKTPDGATTGDIARALDAEPSTIRIALRLMPDTYIDRWRRAAVKGGYTPVWCVVDVPADCPHPTGSA